MISRRAFMGGLAGATAGIWMGIGPSQEVAVADTQQLTDGFTHPPDAARPWVYWFWLNGNLSCTWRVRNCGVPQRQSGTLAPESNAAQAACP